MLKAYLKKLFEIARRGDDREESYYSALAELIESFAESTGKKKISITTLPKKTEAGNPDFRIWDGNVHITGYVEAKHPSEKNLDVIETTPQLKRYLKVFPNVILTNFFEFRLYRNGVLLDQVTIARHFIIQKLKTIPPVEKEKEFLNLLEKFFDFSLPAITEAEPLAKELAKRTRFLKEQIISEQLKEEQETKQGNLMGFYNAFHKYLIGGLDINSFADLYAQTITYGLFAARTRATNGFNRRTAYDYIPKTIGILRQVFRFISLDDDLPLQMQCLIDDISEVLAVTDINQILQQFYKEGKGEDPIIHFYEPFLREYDPKEKEIRGQFYTPISAASYIVRSIHWLLKEKFHLADGLATLNVTNLDPAGGTLTFPMEAIKLAVEEFVSKYGAGGKKDFIKNHILKNFYAFELMMAPYAIGHLKMGFILQELGYQLQDDDRFKYYLTNTLEMEELQQISVPGMSMLAEESHLAGKIKKETPILIITGNPPYYYKSSNPSEIEKNIPKGSQYVIGYNIEKITQDGRTRYKVKPITKPATRNLVVKQKTWIGELIEDYKIVDGQWLNEKNPKGLQDDYVKFIRFAQHKIEQNGEGILGFITNHSYLDNPTFRGMRQSLMNTFDEIYILDLHGNSIKKEKCPDGSKDENIFDIQQGVGIALFIKYKKPAPQTTVYHAECWGLRENKYKWLMKNDVNTTKWQKLSPKSPDYWFIPRDERLLSRYEKYLKVTDIFPLNNVGIVTSRDEFVINHDKDKLLNRIRLFKHSKGSDEQLYQLTQTKPGWNIRKAYQSLQNIPDDELEKYIRPILYRPFDQRYIFYHDDFVERTRKEVMQHMMKENLGLIVNRQIRMNTVQHVLVAHNIVDYHILETANANPYIFPLYLYSESNDIHPSRSSKLNLMIFEKKEKYETKQPNLKPVFVQELTESYKKKPSPEEVFNYIYAVLNSNTYRAKYAEFLKSDFPRIPFAKEYKLFSAMGKLGRELVELHLMKSPTLNKPIAKYQGQGDNRVKKVEYKDKRVYINETNYFEGIETSVWEYQIGGYQVLDKWLKSHKDRIISGEDQLHYLKIITVINQTISLQGKIDKIYPEIEKIIK